MSETNDFSFQQQGGDIERPEAVGQDIGGGERSPFDKPWETLDDFLEATGGASPNFGRSLTAEEIGQGVFPVARTVKIGGIDYMLVLMPKSKGPSEQGPTT